MSSNTISLSVRVSATALANILLSYTRMGVKISNKSELVRFALEDLSRDVVKKGGITPVVGAKEAREVLEMSLGHLGKTNRKRLLKDERFEAEQDTLGDMGGDDIMESIRSSLKSGAESLKKGIENDKAT